MEIHSFLICLVNSKTIERQVWLELIDTAVEETDEYQISRNLEAQHRYLAWRTEKVVWIHILNFCLFRSHMIGDRSSHEKHACCLFFNFELFRNFLVCINIFKVGSGTRCFEEADRGYTCKGRRI